MDQKDPIGFRRPVYVPLRTLVVKLLGLFLLGKSLISTRPGSKRGMASRPLTLWAKRGRLRPSGTARTGRAGSARKRVKEGQHCQEVDLLGPPSFHLQGPKAPPGPVELQAQDLAFLEEHKPPVIPGGASHVGTPNGQTSPEVKGPLQFSAAPAACAFSGPQARISNVEGATPQLCLSPPRWKLASSCSQVPTLSCCLLQAW